MFVTLMQPRTQDDFNADFNLVARASALIALREHQAQKPWVGGCADFLNLSSFILDILLFLKNFL
jgi:hypothetical protein